MSTRKPLRGPGSIAIAALCCVGNACASHVQQPPPRTEERAASSEAPRSTGWVSLEPTRSHDSEASHRAEVLDRRRDLLEHCDEVLEALEARRRSMGSIPAQIATSMVTSTLAGAASMAQSSVTGQPTQTPLPAPGGVGVTQTIRLDREISAIREGRHTLVAAETVPAMLEAMDGLRPHCNPR